MTTKAIATREDMILKAVQRPDDRFTLNEHCNNEWVNLEEGEAWYAAEQAFEADHPYISWAEDEAGHEQRESEAAAWHREHPRPDRKNTFAYALILSDGSTYHRTHYQLGYELGLEVAKVWTKVENRYGSSRFAGRMTLMGILKRMGVSVTELKKEVEVAKATHEANLEAIRIENAKRSVKKLAEQIKKIQDDMPQVIWPEGIAALAALEVQTR